MSYLSAGADISDDGLYRYTLWREWEPSEHGKTATFVMLNPSTADASADDPTIRRCVGFAKSWGCSAMVVLNLFALRSPSPRDLLRADDPVGPKNNEVLDFYLEVMRGGPVVAAWGRLPARRLIDQQRRFIASCNARGVQPQTLGQNADGSPKHPLYLRADTELRPMTLGGLSHVRD